MSIKTHIRAVLLTTAVFGVSSVAYAYPSFRVDQLGSAIYIYKANPENKRYNCTLSFSWAYDSFGETKTGSESFPVGVDPNSGETLAFRMSGAFVNLRMTSGLNSQCNPS